MKADSILAILAAGLLAGCGGRAPAAKRLLHDPPIDLDYLHHTFIPSYDARFGAQLNHSVEHLEACLAEFEAFMHDVEQGKIAVTQNFKSGRWQSFVEKPDAWIAVSYADRLGPVTSFQKHQNRNPAPMIYQFNFGTTGYIERAEMPVESFVFDDSGRLRRWHRENEPYQIGSNQSLEPTADRRENLHMTRSTLISEASRGSVSGGSAPSR